MTSERALEILNAFGADAARWPAGERAECLAQFARDPALTRSLRDAAVLDAAITGWARAPLVTSGASTADAVARALATIGAAATRAAWRVRVWRPLAGVALAASLAAALLLGPPPSAPPPKAMSVAVPSQADADAFRQVFTPTPDEEDVL